MLQRLYAGILRGPSIYARTGRQRLDWMDFRHFGGTNPNNGISVLLDTARTVEFAARVPDFEEPDDPDAELSPEEKSARDAYRRQMGLLQRLREIAQEAKDFQNDHGESALFVGFPLLWIPKADLSREGGGKETRILAPISFVPIALEVRRGGRPGASIKCLGEGADLLIPNPALAAWIEQQTGRTTEELFNDEEGSNPWRELEEIIAFVRQALDLSIAQLPAFQEETLLEPLPEKSEFSREPALIPSAMLGLFPIANLGLLRDTRWMIDNENALQGPIRTFLKPAALEITRSEPSPASPPGFPSEANSLRDFRTEMLVTHADPCQAAAVRHARVSEALVIHGPPGTGKSQTIANIIGDHLARGERVLFVCDKRTAIDVVKYRIDALGLGRFCGVVHDPARDRSSLYKELRTRLEDLPSLPLQVDYARELALVNEQLGDLHRDLTAAYRALNVPGDQTTSFHDAVGAWLELVGLAPNQEGEPTTALTVDEVQRNQNLLDEIWRRATRSSWRNSPWRDSIAIAISDFLAKSPAEWQNVLGQIARTAEKADEFADKELLPFDPITSLIDQSRMRRELAGLLENLAGNGMAEFCRHVATIDSATLAALVEERDRLKLHFQEIETDGLDSELRLLLTEPISSVSEINARLLAIEVFLPKAGTWKSFISRSEKVAAAASLSSLGLSLSRENLTKARTFYRGVRARLGITNFVRSCLRDENTKCLPEDSTLRTAWQRINIALAAVQLGALEPLAVVREYLNTTLADLTWVPNLSQNLQISANRGDQLAILEQQVESTSIFSDEARQKIFATWRANAQCATSANAWYSAISVLEDAVRLTEALSRLPSSLAEHCRWHLEQMTSPEQAFLALRRVASENEIRQRAISDKALLTVDSDRVQAAFDALSDAVARKQQMVRAQVGRGWQRKQQSRLLASTGTRLNGLGAALKQRLVTRGQRSLKLRQMLATGAASPGGDALFDICPVWMTSPATVAQAFPREPLFDVVIFDEASQCRIEEALPSLLRARRVVVAGDPKQLPPTRFFESGPTDSADAAAETMEGLFEQQQSEVEDLLGAALNLNVQEAFLDVHYRSRNESLIGFSNEQFYGTRLQPIPGHPRNRALTAPITIHRVAGVYDKNRTNGIEAQRVVDLVAELLDDQAPPSVGIACFNIPQRNLITELLEQKAEQEPRFASQLATARERRGSGSFEGLFVKNLENVQGDERDVIVICTTFAPNPEGKFRRNFGALSGGGGGRRLNVLVTRARDAIHLITSIPRSEYAALPSVQPGQLPNGRFYLYSYLRYAEALAKEVEDWRFHLETLRAASKAECRIQKVESPSRVAQSLGHLLRDQMNLGTIVHWGNDGFCIDAALSHPDLPADVTLGILADFNRFSKTPDPIEWELFRSLIFSAQGWTLHRIWTPALFRNPTRELNGILVAHEAEIARQKTHSSGLGLKADA